MDFAHFLFDFRSVKEEHVEPLSYGTGKESGRGLASTPTESLQFAIWAHVS